MKLFLAVTVALVANTALAQDVPQFDEQRGFDILGTLQSGGMVVNNGPHSFHCFMDEDPDARFAFLADCIPILGPNEAARVGDAVQGGDQAAEEFADAVNALPVFALFGAVQRTFVSFNCELTRDMDQVTIQTELARQLALDRGYTGPLTDTLLDEIGEAGEAALDRMVENGMIEIAANDSSARLVDCP